MQVLRSCDHDELQSYGWQILSVHVLNSLGTDETRATHEELATFRRTGANNKRIPFWKVHPFLDSAFQKGMAWPQTAFPMGKKILIFLE